MTLLTLKKLGMVGLVSSLAFAANAQSSSGSSSTSTTKVKSTKNKLNDGDIDEEITNARMRAANGSKSKISGSVSVGYTGASLENPFDGIRPNLAGNAQSQSTSRLTSSLSGRYRLNKNSSISAGIGLQLLQPFQDNAKLNTNEASLKQANVLNVRNPFISYSSTYKVGDYQASSSASYTRITDKVLTSLGFQNTFDVGQSFVKAWGDSGFSTGVSFSLTQYANASDRPEGRVNREFGIYPIAEYQFNDTFVFRTVFGYFNYANNNDDNFTTFNRQYEYQSMGIGIVAARNVWIYPNIQFVPDELDAGFTNIAVSATINLF